MGLFRDLFDNMKKLTQGYDDDDDTFDGAEEEESVDIPASEPVSAASSEFDNTFGVHNAPAASEPEAAEEPEEAAPSGGLFRNLMPKRKRSAETADTASQAAPAAPVYNAAPVAAAAPTSAAVGTAVIYTFDDITRAGELAAIVVNRQQVIMSLDGIDEALARRLLDVTIGICAAANANITKVSGRTYYLTPRY